MYRLYTQSLRRNSDTCVYAYEKTDSKSVVIGAASVIIFVALSRVMLARRYLGDVIVGVPLGLAFVLALDSLIEDLRWGLLTAIGFAGVFLAVTGLDGTAFSLLGVAGGGLVGALLRNSIAETVTKTDGLACGVVGLPLILAVVPVESAVTHSQTLLDAAVTVGAHAVLVAGIFLLPVTAVPAVQRVLNTDGVIGGQPRKKKLSHNFLGSESINHAIEVVVET